MVLPGRLNFERGSQRLVVEGKSYDARNIEDAIRQGADAYPPEVWEVLCFLARWFDDSPCLCVHTSGSTGAPKEIPVEKERMMQSARLTCLSLGLTSGDTALLCMNLRYIGAQMVVVRALVADLRLIVRPATGHPLANVRTPLRFAAMVPLQVYNTLRVPDERAQLCHTDILIIGGGAINPDLLASVKQLPGEVYSTYGMTETLSHIALRRLNGLEASDYYRPFPGINLSLSEEQTLVIDAPGICPEKLYTHDVARIYPDGTFSILGRSDNIINTGGIKVQAEEVERLLTPVLQAHFAITSAPDPRLGESVVLLTDAFPHPEAFMKQAQDVLPPYHMPKQIYLVPHLPEAGNGKTNRKACRELAARLKAEKPEDDFPTTA